MKILIILLNVGFVKKAYEEREVKVKDHTLITGKYWGSVDPECNLNLSLNKKIPVLFYNLKNYSSYLLFKKLENTVSK